MMTHRSLFAFAGLWERWRDKASGEIVRSFTIITTEANCVCAPIHGRMLVILDPSNYGRWLGEEATDPMAAGNVKNDKPGLLTPLAA